MHLSSLCVTTTQLYNTYLWLQHWCAAGGNLDNKPFKSSQKLRFEFGWEWSKNCNYEFWRTFRPKVWRSKCILNLFSWRQEIKHGRIRISINSVKIWFDWMLGGFESWFVRENDIIYFNSYCSIFAIKNEKIKVCWRTKISY